MNNNYFAAVTISDGLKMKITGSLICLLIILLSFPASGQDTDNDSNEEKSDTTTSSQQVVKEKKYVTDKLRLSLYKKANSNSGTIKLLISGDALDVLERTGPYSKVRTVEGETGWVKNGFLVSIPTASYLLIEEQKKNEELSSLLDKYSNTQKIVDDYEDTIQKMNADSELVNEELMTARQQLEQVTETNTDLKQELNAYTQNSSHLSLKELINIILQYWYVIAGSLLLLFIIGFIVGKQLVEGRIRKRFQGVRVL